MKTRLRVALMISVLSIGFCGSVLAQTWWTTTAWTTTAGVWGTAGGWGDDCANGIKLNTDIPFVGKCIVKSTDANVAGNQTTIANAFPKLLWGLMRIVMTTVVIVWFMGILVGGFMISAGGVDASLMGKGKKLIISVIIGLVVLGLSGIILNLINPNFFGTDSQPTSSP
jgi:hypothetical protein